MNVRLRKMVTAGMFVALGVSLSTIYIPVGASKCFPIQHMINVLSGVLLGPGYAVAMAFCTSMIRNLLGTGSLLAFPGSMVGAFCCALLFKYTNKLVFAYAGEIIGTGILGALISFPLAALIMGNPEAALFTYVIPFLISTIGGTAVAIILVTALYKTKAIKYVNEMLEKTGSDR